MKQLPPHRLAAGRGLASQQEWPGLPSRLQAPWTQPACQTFRSYGDGQASALSPFPSLLFWLLHVDKQLAQSDLPRVPQKFKALTRIHRHHPRGGLNRTMNGHSIRCAVGGFPGGRGSDSGGWEGKGLAPTCGPPGELRLMEQMGRPQASLS